MSWGDLLLLLLVVVVVVVVIIVVVFRRGSTRKDGFRAGPVVLLESCLQTCMTYTIAECTVNNS
jgi:hypothetical protein